MSRYSDASNVSRRQFLAVAGSVVAANSLAVGEGSGSAQALSHPLTSGPYLVTIVVANNAISYRAQDGLGHSVVANPLTIGGAGETVTWKVDIGGKKYHLAIIFLKTPLVNSSNKPVYAVSGTESDEGTNKIGGMIGSKASGTYKYFVRVIDDTTDIEYPDDPIIIVGKAPNAREQLIEADGQLKEVREKIDTIEKELGEVIDKLK
jgi:hypothetical protein